MKDVILEADNISLEYKTRVGFKTFKHKAIEGLSFRLGRGEIVGVSGRNGAGKTTLLRILAGVLRPDEGEVIVADGVRVSFLSLGLGFDGNLTGRDNAIISCMLNGLSLHEAKSLSQGIKEFSELDDFFDQPVKTYSAGMRSRLGFSTSVLAEVDILLLDEVLSVGDNQFREKAEEVMLEKLRGTTSVVLVSHNEKQLELLCDRVISL